MAEQRNPYRTEWLAKVLVCLLIAAVIGWTAYSSRKARKAKQLWTAVEQVIDHSRTIQSDAQPQPSPSAGSGSH